MMRKATEKNYPKSYIYPALNLSQVAFAYNLYAKSLPFIRFQILLSEPDIRQLINRETSEEHMVLLYCLDNSDFSIIPNTNNNNNNHNTNGQFTDSQPAFPIIEGIHNYKPPLFRSIPSNPIALQTRENLNLRDAQQQQHQQQLLNLKQVTLPNMEANNNAYSFIPNIPLIAFSALPINSTTNTEPMLDATVTMTYRNDKQSLNQSAQLSHFGQYPVYNGDR
ncbi:unnamed protein product [Trichobilharzia regenti]|nr:unnamed protein product [Trichobilharzia regenti]